MTEFDRDWALQRTLPKPSLWAALAPGAGRVLLVTGVLHAIQLASQFTQPLLLNQIVAGLGCKATGSAAVGSNGVCPTQGTLYGYAALLLASNVVYSVTASHENIMLAVFGLRCRNKLMGALYRKTLRLSSGALQSESSGRIVTLMSNDAQKLQEFLPALHNMWGSPALVGAALWLLYSVLSWSTFIGLAVIFLLMPLTGIAAGKLFGLRKGLVGLADKRVSLISEVVNGMKVIKLYAWEQPFKERIEEVRLQETTLLWRISKLSATFGVMLFAAPIFIGVAAIGTFSLTTNALTAARLYTALSCFNLIRFPLVFLPFILIQFLNAKVAAGRLIAFLTAEEAELLADGDQDCDGCDTKAASNGNDHAKPLAKGGIDVAGPAEFHWPPPAKKEEEKEPTQKGKRDKKKGGDAAKEPEVDAAAVEVEIASPPFRLRDVTLSVPPGALVMVIGPVGSGKSTLLAALTRFLVRDSGTVRMAGSCAYVPQTAWILNATVEKNITFGLHKDEQRYAAALAAAQLGPDLEILPFGDQTEIGERGVTLSGGQKQRVSIARLVYAAADINLLDDPLSAVDAHVGAALFDKCLNGALKGTTRVLVTNALQYLPQADLIVVMDGGAVREVGTFNQLREKGTDFNALCETHSIDNEKEDPKANGKPADKAMRVSMDGKPIKAADVKAGTDGPGKPGTGATERNLTGDERRVEGRVSGAVWVHYARAAGSVGVIGLIAFGFSCEYGSKSFLDAWLGFWSGDRFGWTKHGKTHYYLLIYFCMFLVNAVFVYSRSLLYYYFSTRASRNLHGHMLDRVLRLPQSFFDSTPSGRIINRFSRDTEVLDSLLPMVLIQLTGCTFNIITTLVIICVASQWFIIALPPIMICYVALQRYYVPTTIELQRIESITRSPIYSDLAEAVAGVATIRAFRRSRHFTAAADTRVFKNGRAVLSQRLAAEWLNVRLRFLGMAVSSLSAFLVIAGGVPAGLAGLVLVYSLDVTRFMEVGTQQASEAESKMNSVERMLEYDSQPAEAAADTPPLIEATLPKNWPNSGALTVEKLQMRYRPELPLVLRSVSFEVPHAHKVGIVGRTGSGKSSLFTAFFRLVEPCGGRILLDGVDVMTLGTKQLRRSMALVPQDPFMFGGTVRQNLDPFNEHSDEALWQALQRTGLKAFVEEDPKKLELLVVDNGANFSLGQRQLLCMSRALLRNCRVLLMDEATASVDLDSDAIIQTTVRESFAQCTVITIAHRLNTIMDSDKVLVMSDGAVAEYGAPVDLLKDAAGPFSALVQGTGSRNSDHLRKLAQAGSSKTNLAALAGSSNSLSSLS